MSDIDDLQQDDDLDIDSLFGETDSAEPDRSPVGDLAYGFTSNISKNVFSAKTAGSVATNLLNDHDATKLEHAINAKDELVGEFNETVAKVSGPAYKVAGSIEDALPEGKIRNVVGKLKGFFDDNRREDHRARKVDILKTEETNAKLDSIFQTNVEAEKKVDDANLMARTEGIANISLQKANLQQSAVGTNNILSLLTDLRGSVVANTGYITGINKSYQRNMLEVNFKQFYVQQKMLEVNELTSKATIAELKAIHKNTGLPEITKLRNSEVVEQRLKQQLADRITGNEGNPSVLAGMMKKVTKRVKSIGSSVAGALGMANMAADMAKMGMEDDFGPKRSKAFTAGKGLAGLASSFIGGAAGAARRKYFEGDGRLAGLYQGLADNVDSLKLKGREFIDSGENEEGAKGLLKRGLGSLFRKGDDEKITGDLGLQAKGLKSPAQFDSQFHRTVIDVIPGILTHMDLMLQKVAGVENPSELKYDFLKYELTNKSDFLKRVNKRTATGSNIDEEVTDVADTLFEGADDLTDKEKSAVRSALARSAFKRADGDKTFYSQRDLYDEQFRDHFSDLDDDEYAKLSTKLEDSLRIRGTEEARKVSAAMDSLGNVTDPSMMISDSVDEGNLKELQQLGLVKLSANGTPLLDVEAYRARIIESYQSGNDSFVPNKDATAPKGFEDQNDISGIVDRVGDIFDKRAASGGKLNEVLKDAGAGLINKPSGIISNKFTKGAADFAVNNRYSKAVRGSKTGQAVGRGADTVGEYGAGIGYGIQDTVRGATSSIKNTVGDFTGDGTKFSDAIDVVKDKYDSIANSKIVTTLKNLSAKDAKEFLKYYHEHPEEAIQAIEENEYVIKAANIVMSPKESAKAGLAIVRSKYSEADIKSGVMNSTSKISSVLSNASSATTKGYSKADINADKYELDPVMEAMLIAKLGKKGAVDFTKAKYNEIDSDPDSLLSKGKAKVKKMSVSKLMKKLRRDPKTGEVDLTAVSEEDLEGISPGMLNIALSSRASDAFSKVGDYFTEKKATFFDKDGSGKRDASEEEEEVKEEVGFFAKAKDKLTKKDGSKKGLLGLLLGGGGLVAGLAGTLISKTIGTIFGDSLLGKAIDGGAGIAGGLIGGLVGGVTKGIAGAIKLGFKGLLTAGGGLFKHLVAPLTKAVFGGMYKYFGGQAIVAGLANMLNVSTLLSFGKKDKLKGMVKKAGSLLKKIPGKGMLAKAGVGAAAYFAADTAAGAVASRVAGGGATTVAEKAAVSAAEKAGTKKAAVATGAKFVETGAKFVAKRVIMGPFGLAYTAGEILYRAGSYGFARWDKYDSLENPDEITKVRLAMYGITDESKMKTVLKFERYIIGEGIVTEADNASPLTEDIISKAFGIPKNNTKAMDRFQHWYSVKFLPVLVAHLVSMKEKTDANEFREIKRLDISQQVMYMYYATGLEADIFDVETSNPYGHAKVDVNHIRRMIKQIRSKAGRDYDFSALPLMKLDNPNTKLSKEDIEKIVSTNRRHDVSKNLNMGKREIFRPTLDEPRFVGPRRPDSVARPAPVNTSVIAPKASPIKAALSGLLKSTSLKYLAGDVSGGDEDSIYRDGVNHGSTDDDKLGLLFGRNKSIGSIPQRSFVEIDDAVVSSNMYRIVDLYGRKPLSAIKDRMMLVFDVALAANINPDIFLTLIAQESAFKINAKAKTSSAAGLAQIITSTWTEWKARYRDIIRVPNQVNRLDPVYSVILAALHAREAYAEYGVEDLIHGYLPHLLGDGGARGYFRNLKRDPSLAVSASVTPAAIKANKALFMHKGRTASYAMAWHKIESFLLRSRQNFRIQGALEHFAKGDTPYQKDNKSSPRTGTIMNSIARVNANNPSDSHAPVTVGGVMGLNVPLGEGAGLSPGSHIGPTRANAPVVAPVDHSKYPPRGRNVPIMNKTESLLEKNVKVSEKIVDTLIRMADKEPVVVKVVSSDNNNEKVVSQAPVKESVTISDDMLPKRGYNVSNIS